MYSYSTVVTASICDHIPQYHIKDNRKEKALKTPFNRGTKSWFVAFGVTDEAVSPVRQFLPRTLSGTLTPP